MDWLVGWFGVGSVGWSIGGSVGWLGLLTTLLVLSSTTLDLWETCVIDQELLLTIFIIL